MIKLIILGTCKKTFCHFNKKFNQFACKKVVACSKNNQRNKVKTGFFLMLRFCAILRSLQRDFCLAEITLYYEVHPLQSTSLRKEGNDQSAQEERKICQSCPSPPCSPPKIDGLSEVVSCPPNLLLCWHGVTLTLFLVPLSLCLLSSAQLTRSPPYPCLSLLGLGQPQPPHQTQEEGKGADHTKI